MTSLSALGMAGEFYKLATDELEAVISTVVGASGRLKTLIGVSAPSSEVATRLARHAAHSGADGLLVLPPYAIKPSADEIIAHYGAIARAADLPIMAQDGSDEIRAVLRSTLVRLCREVSAVSYIKVEDVAPAPDHAREALGTAPPAVRIGRARRLDAYDRGAVVHLAPRRQIFARLDAAFESDRPPPSAAMQRSFRSFSSN